MAIGGGAGQVPRPIRGGTVAEAGLLHTKKKHVNGSPESATRLRKKGQPKFLELIGATRQAVDEYLIEFESARGRKLRIHCKTNTPPDWPVLLRAWRRAER